MKKFLFILCVLMSCNVFAHHRHPIRHHDYVFRHHHYHRSLYPFLGIVGGAIILNSLKNKENYGIESLELTPEERYEIIKRRAREKSGYTCDKNLNCD